jgi:hypothetical protein
MTPYSPPPTLYTCILYTFSHREGERGVRANQREGLRGNSSPSRSKIKKLLTVSPVYKLYETTVKTTFRIWCLCSYLVHA